MRDVANYILWWTDPCLCVLSLQAQAPTLILDFIMFFCLGLDSYVYTLSSHSWLSHPIVASNLSYLLVFFLSFELTRWVCSTLRHEVAALGSLLTEALMLCVSPITHLVPRCADRRFGGFCSSRVFGVGRVSSSIHPLLISLATSPFLSPHRESILQHRAYLATFTDSGLWDTFLLVSFDGFYRVIFVYTLAPLSENTLVEKAGIRVFSELAQTRVFYFAYKNADLNFVLLNLARALALIFTLYAYTILVLV